MHFLQEGIFAIIFHIASGKQNLADNALAAGAEFLKLLWVICFDGEAAKERRATPTCHSISALRGIDFADSLSMKRLKLPQTPVP